MIVFSWVSEFKWIPNAFIKSASPFWVFDCSWLWFQFYIYNTTTAQLVTRVMNENIDNDRRILDAEIDKILESEQ